MLSQLCDAVQLNSSQLNLICFSSVWTRHCNIPYEHFLNSLHSSTELWFVWNCKNSPKYRQFWINWSTHFFCLFFSVTNEKTDSSCCDVQTIGKLIQAKLKNICRKKVLHKRLPICSWLPKWVWVEMGWGQTWIDSLWSVSNWFFILQFFIGWTDSALITQTNWRNFL